MATADPRRGRFHRCVACILLAAGFLMIVSAGALWIAARSDRLSSWSSIPAVTGTKQMGMEGGAWGVHAGHIAYLRTHLESPTLTSVTYRDGRMADSAYRQQRLDRMKLIIGYRNTLQGALAEVATSWWPHWENSTNPQGSKLVLYSTPTWPIVLLLAACGAMCIVSGWRRWKRAEPGACRTCGYNLHGLPANSRCPECGKVPKNVSARTAHPSLAPDGGMTR